MKKYIFLFGVGIFISLFVSRPAVADYIIDENGNLVISQGEVLGKNDNQASSPQAQNQSASKQNNGKDQKSKTATPVPIVSVAPVRMDGGLNLEVRENLNQLHVRFQDKFGNWTETASDTPQLTIRKKDISDEITIRASESAAVIMRNRTLAKTHFPLMVNLETNELIVTTPKGSKVVTILPDQAVAHMLAANVLDQAGGKGGLLWLREQNSTPSGQLQPTATPGASMKPSASASALPTLTASSSVISSASPGPEIEPESEIVLTESDTGDLVYEIPGVKYKQLFGMFKIRLERKAVVSAETGELVRISQNLIAQILDMLSV